MKLPELLWRWYQLMEGNRPYRQCTRHLDEAAGEWWKKLGYHLYKEDASDLAKAEEQARQFKTLSGPDRVRVQVQAPRQVVRPTCRVRPS